MRKFIVPIIVTFCAAGAGFWTGTSFLAPLLAGDPVQPASVDDEPPAVIEAGRMALHLPGRSLPIIVEVDVTVDPERAEDLVTIRDKLIEIAAGAIEMPIVRARGADMDRIRQAMLIVAEQEAPWLSALKMSVVWSGDG